jgi:hypothetical protein
VPLAKQRQLEALEPVSGTLPLPLSTPGLAGTVLCKYLQEDRAHRGLRMPGSLFQAMLAMPGVSRPPNRLCPALRTLAGCLVFCLLSGSSQGEAQVGRTRDRADPFCLAPLVLTGFSMGCRACWAHSHQAPWWSPLPPLPFGPGVVTFLVPLTLPKSLSLQ